MIVPFNRRITQQKLMPFRQGHALFMSRFSPSATRRSVASPKANKQLGKILIPGAAARGLLFCTTYIWLCIIVIRNLSAIVRFSR